MPLPNIYPPVAKKNIILTGVPLGSSILAIKGFLFMHPYIIYVFGNIHFELHMYISIPLLMYGTHFQFR